MKINWKSAGWALVALFFLLDAAVILGGWRLPSRPYAVALTLVAAASAYVLSRDARRDARDARPSPYRGVNPAAPLSYKFLEFQKLDENGKPIGEKFRTQHGGEIEFTFSEPRPKSRTVVVLAPTVEAGRDFLAANPMPVAVQPRRPESLRGMTNYDVIQLPAFEDRDDAQEMIQAAKLGMGPDSTWQTVGAVAGLLDHEAGR